MEMKGNTLSIVLLVVGLVVGAGAGYILKPEDGDSFDTPDNGSTITTPDTVYVNGEGGGYFAGFVSVIAICIGATALYGVYIIRIEVSKLKQKVDQTRIKRY